MINIDLKEKEGERKKQRVKTRNSVGQLVWNDYEYTSHEYTSIVVTM